MIKFENVCFSYENGTQILKDLSFEISEGETVGLIGCNGAGKSTLMKVLLGLLPHEGIVKVSDLELNKNNLEEIRRKLGFVLQDSDNQMFMPTVYEDMMFGPLNYGHTKEEAEARVDEVLEQLNLTYLKHKYNHKISGGEKRMAAIATILTMRPKVILMDEPSTALDPENRRRVINAINDLNITKIIASHDLDMILDTCDRVILMHDGKIIADGKTEDILRDEKLLEANHMELPFKLQGLREFI
ncbi:MAG: energy-coupling factor ABC transporter ATP-binding protein [Oscillospiraceae bacterium]|nr:energy-coupling factor ABC transporter ATP-binding protein [Candidatus Limimonas coprohippi]